MFVETHALRELRVRPMLPAMARDSKSTKRARRRNPAGTNPPGRPPRQPPPDAESHGARLRRSRIANGFATVRALAERVGIDPRKLAEMERGRTRIDSEDLERLARALPIETILRGAAASVRTVPRKLFIAAFESEGRPDQLIPDEPEFVLLPGDMPRRLRDAAGLFAATVIDRSADEDYAAGTTLYLRPPEPDERLPWRAPVVVRFFMGARGAGARTREVLYGRLNRLETGEIMLQIRSSNMLLRGAREIQGGSTILHGLSERVRSLLPQSAGIEYRPRLEDSGEILGIVEWAIGPPRPQAGLAEEPHAENPRPRELRG